MFLKISQITGKHLCRSLIFNKTASPEHIFAFAYNAKSFSRAIFVFFAFAYNAKSFTIAILFFTSIRALLLDELPKVILVPFHDSLPKKHLIKIGLISLDIQKQAGVKIVPSLVIRDKCCT